MRIHVWWTLAPSVALNTSCSGVPPWSPRSRSRTRSWPNWPEKLNVSCPVPPARTSLPPVARRLGFGVAPHDVVALATVVPVPPGDRRVAHAPGVAAKGVVAVAAEQVVVAADRGALHVARVAGDAVVAATAPQPVVAAMGEVLHGLRFAAQFVGQGAAEQQVVAARPVARSCRVAGAHRSSRCRWCRH